MRCDVDRLSHTCRGDFGAGIDFVLSNGDRFCFNRDRLSFDCNRLGGNRLGFVSVNDGGKDVFVHRSALSRAGLDSLAEGQQVTLGVVEGQKGREAQSITVHD